MYGDLKKLEEMKTRCNSVSPTFCMAKWLHVSMHLLNGHTHSCYLPLPHKIPLKEIEDNPSALHNTSHKKEQRKLMLEGKRPAECSTCWSVEDLPGDQVSDRQMRSLESWTYPYFDQIRNLPWDANVNPTYVEVSFSSLCNLKCSYCSPHVSSSWEDEIRRHGPYRLSGMVYQDSTWMKSQGMMPIPENESNPYVEAFWKWLPEMVHSLRVLRITGGEPLLSKYTYQLFDWLMENPQPELQLDINSNMAMPERYVEKFFDATHALLGGKKVRRVMLHTSIDTYGKQAEYLRHGLDFDRFDQNIRRFLEEFKTAELALMCAFNNLSVVGFEVFMAWFQQLRAKYGNQHRAILVDLPHLQGPSHQTARILTPDYVEMMEKGALMVESRMAGSAGFRPAELAKVKRIIEWMKSPADPAWVSSARADFHLFFSEHDRRRGTDFLKTFPEMTGFWELCRKEAAGT